MVPSSTIMYIHTVRLEKAFKFLIVQVNVKVNLTIKLIGSRVPIYLGHNRILLIKS